MKAVSNGKVRIQAQLGRRLVTNNTVLPRLGEIDVNAFLARDWHRRPRLIRQAIDGITSPVNREALFDLARREDVQARLITHFDGHWQLRHGPLTRLPSTRRADWTVLIQAVDQHVDAAAALLARFRFLPDARLDDLMISYATDRGGVGPHVDSYDVFLLQVAGRRRWRISTAQCKQLVPDLPLRILADFEAEQQWVLDPGDLLYLPPGIAHEGVAIGESITCSIGFRAPQWADLVDQWHNTLAERQRPEGGYSDPKLAATKVPAKLPDALVDQAFSALSRQAPVKRDAVRMLLATSSEPGQSVYFPENLKRHTCSRFAIAMSARGITLDRRTRLIYSGDLLGINGEVQTMPACKLTRVLVKRLADRRMLDPVALLGLRSIDTIAYDALVNFTFPWYQARWLNLMMQSETQKPSATR